MSSVLMNAGLNWETFWVVCLAFSGVAFLLIEVVVIFRGFGELVEMIRSLRETKE